MKVKGQVKQSGDDEQFAHLEELAGLASVESSEDRRRILREVTDLLLENSHHLDEKNTEKFGEILCQIVFEMEMKIRRYLADAMAEMETPPRQLILRLANDEIEVARPVLMKSKLLEDEDLLGIIEQLTQEHMLAIAVRKSVSKQVSHALTDRGNDGVLQTLAGNSGALLSRQTMETMVKRSGENEDLCDALLARHDFPADLEEKIFSHLSAALKEHILSQNMATEGEVIDQFLWDARNHMNTHAGKEELTDAERFIQRKEKMNQLNLDLILNLIRGGKIPEFLAAIAYLAHVDLPIVRRMVADESGEKMGVICKAIGFDRDSFAELLALTDFAKRRGEEQVAALLNVYDRIPEDSAKRAVRFMKTRRNLQ